MRLLSATLAALFCIGSRVVWAAPDGRDDLLSLQIEMAEQSFSLNPSDENRSQLLGIYEIVVEQHCLVPKEKDQECDTWVSKLTDLFPKSPVLPCARFGLMSPECVEAYAAQEVRPYVFTTARTPAQSSGAMDQIKAHELDSKLNDTRVQQEVQTHFVKASNLFREYQAKKTLELFDTIVREYEKAVSLACVSAKGVLTNIPALKGRGRKPPIELPTPPNQPPQVKENPLFRIRAISPLCRKTIDVTLKFDPKLPVAICAEQGRFSPQCQTAIDARIELRKRWGASPKAATAPTPGKRAPVSKPPALESF